MSINPAPHDPHVVLVHDTEHVRQVFGPYEGKLGAEAALAHLKTWPTLQDAGWQWDIQPCHRVDPPGTQPRPHLRGPRIVEDVPAGSGTVAGSRVETG